MIADYLNGESAHSVGKRYGVSIDNVRYHVKKLGLWPGGKRIIPAEIRFWQKVKKTNSCWKWTSGRFPNGYGCFSIFGQSILAHRVAYEMTYGPISFTLQLHHKCENKLCVNPKHLEPLTPKQHAARHPRKGNQS